MNATNDDMKEQGFRRQYVFPFEKYVNRLKEWYNTLEDLGQLEFEDEKFWNLLNHINCPDEQFNACVHTASKYHTGNFSGACTYLSSEVSHIFPEKYPESQWFNKNGNFKGGRNRNRCIAADGMNHINNQTSHFSKQNGVDIYDPSRYCSPDKWCKLSQSTMMTLLWNPNMTADKKKIDSRSTRSKTMSDTIPADSQS